MYHPPAVREKSLLEERKSQLSTPPHWICTRLLTHYFQFCSFRLLLLVRESRTVHCVHHFKHVSIAAHTGREQEINSISLPKQRGFPGFSDATDTCLSAYWLTSHTNTQDWLICFPTASPSHIFSIAGSHCSNCPSLHVRSGWPSLSLSKTRWLHTMRTKARLSC